jgi:transcriptional regulator with XRE-family HTH domain
VTTTPSQCKAARELIGWTQRRLANAAGVGRATIHKGEEDGSRLSDWAQRAIRAALESGGVQFIAKNGGADVRLKEPRMTITGAQVKTARKLLGWTLLDLGYRAHVSHPTIVTFEGARRTVRPDKVQAVQRTLEAAGFEFIAGNGERPSVRLRKGK